MYYRDVLNIIVMYTCTLYIYGVLHTYAHTYVHTVLCLAVATYSTSKIGSMHTVCTLCHIFMNTGKCILKVLYIHVGKMLCTHMSVHTYIRTYVQVTKQLSKISYRIGTTQVNTPSDHLTTQTCTISTMGWVTTPQL